MTIKPFIKVLATLAMGVMMIGANANSISFDAASYEADSNGQITVSVNYDFSDFAMFGGGMNLLYDAGALEFVSYTRADLTGSQAQDAASPVGALEDAGNYAGFGIGTFEFFNGMSDAGAVGTFVFNVIGAPAGVADCGGAALCLTPDLPTNPMVSLAGQDVTADIFGAGVSADLIVDVNPIPVPAAVWFMLSGLGALLGFGRKSA